MTFRGKALEYKSQSMYSTCFVLHMKRVKVFIVLSRVVLCLLSLHTYVIQVKGCQNGSCAVLLSLFYSFIFATLIFKGLTKAFNNRRELSMMVILV